MTDTLRASLFVAGAGMKAQGTRLRVISENVANADSTAKEPGGDPYRRKTISFAEQLDRSLNADLVEVRRKALRRLRRVVRPVRRAGELLSAIALLPL